MMCSNFARMCSSDLPTKAGTASRLSRSRVRPDSIQLLRASFLGLPNWSTRPTGCRVDKTSRIPARGQIRASSRSNRCIRSLSRSTVVANGLPRHQRREMRETQLLRLRPGPRQPAPTGAWEVTGIALHGQELKGTSAARTSVDAGAPRSRRGGSQRRAAAARRVCCGAGVL